MWNWSCRLTVGSQWGAMRVTRSPSFGRIPAFREDRAVLVAHELVGRAGGGARGDERRAGVRRHRLRPGVDDDAVGLDRADDARCDGQRGSERRTAGRDLDRAVLLVHEQVGARLNFGEGPMLEVEVVRAGAAAGDYLRPAARLPSGRRGMLRDAPTARRSSRMAVGQRRHVLEMAVIGLDAALAEVGVGRFAARAAPLLGVGHAGAALPHVDVDEDTDGRSGVSRQRIDPASLSTTRARSAILSRARRAARSGSA